MRRIDAFRKSCRPLVIVSSGRSNVLYAKQGGGRNVSTTEDKGTCSSRADTFTFHRVRGAHPWWQTAISLRKPSSFVGGRVQRAKDSAAKRAVYYCDADRGHPFEVVLADIVSSV